jgi:ribonuclease T2
MRRVASALLLAAAIAGCQPEADTAGSEAPERAAASIPVGRNFEFYVLALSWSPSYCESEGEDANRQQCSSTRPYAFVVHGLWPQFERGYPEDCATAEPHVSNERLRTLYDLMPSAGLIRHEWRSHGTCSGLSQSDYFAVLREARRRVAIPDGLDAHDSHRVIDPDFVERAFLDANAGLESGGIAVTCDRRYLREVRICLTKELDFRSCPEIDRRGCRRDGVVMPPVRGG